MKLLSKVFIGLFLLNFIVSCGKYEEGPAFSLLTKQSRLAGDYEVESYYINDEEINLTEDLNIISYIVSYDRDGTGTRKIEMQGNTLEEEFEWKFCDNKEYLHERIKISDELYTEWTKNKKILRLSRNQLWVKYENPMEEIIIHFNKK